MSKTFRSYDPDQQLLLPAALQEWLPENHLAYFISDVVDQLDLVGRHCPLPGRGAGRPSLPSPDDGEGAALRLLHRGGLLPAHRPEAPRGHRLPGVGGQQHSRLPHHLRLSQGPSGSLGRTVPSGIGTVPGGGAGEAGPRGPGQHQGEGQRLKAQGHELWDG